MGKAILEDAEIRRKNLSCVWIDAKKAFDSVNHKWLELCLQMQYIPDKIAKLITTTIKNWLINLDIKTPHTKETIGVIKLNQGILQGRLVLCKTFHHLSQPNCMISVRHRRIHLSHIISTKTSLTCRSCTTRRHFINP